MENIVTFWSDVTGKTIHIGNLIKPLTTYFTSSTSTVKFNGETSYSQIASEYSLTNGSAPKIPLTFAAPSDSYSYVTVTGYAINENGKPTNFCKEIIKINRALSELSLSANKTAMYTGETAKVTFTPDSTLTYGWSPTEAVATASSTGVSLTSSRVTNENAFNFTAPATISSSSTDAIVKVETPASYYSTLAKSATKTITIMQAATTLKIADSTSYNVTLNVGSALNLTYIVGPDNCYMKNVTVSGGDATILPNVSTATANKLTSDAALKPGVVNLTLKTGDNKQTATCTATVTYAGTTSLTVNPSIVNMNIGGSETATIDYTGVILTDPTSNNPSVATASRNLGIVTITAGNTAGTSTITISGNARSGYDGGNKSATITANVKEITMVIE